MDKLDAMRMFVAVVDSAGFAAAARKLRCSPAAVTRAVAQLEEELGVSLLTRTTRSVKPTERGATWLISCRRILADIAESERTARDEQSEPHGLIHISAPIAMGSMHVQPVVESLLKSYVNLRVRLSLSDRLAHLVEDEVDVAVRIGELSDSGLVALRIASVRHVLVASPKYLKQRGEPSRLQDLTKHSLIDFESLNPTQGWPFSGTTHRTEPRLSVNSVASAIAAAEAGLGITRALSYQVQQSVDAKRLSIVLPEVSKKATPVHIIYPPNRRASINVSTFITEFRSRLNSAAGVYT